MNNLQLIKNNEGELIVTGALSYDSVTPLFWEKSKTLLKNSPTPIHINLQNVTQSDSAGVALLVAWKCLTRKEKKEMFFLHVPDQMQAIMRVSGLEKLLIEK